MENEIKGDGKERRENEIKKKWEERWIQNVPYRTKAKLANADKHFRCYVKNKIHGRGYVLCTPPHAYLINTWWDEEEESSSLTYSPRYNRTNEPYLEVWSKSIWIASITPEQANTTGSG